MSEASAPPAGPQAIPSLHNTFGAMLIGSILTSALWGIATMQVYEYYIYKKDPWHMKALVGGVWFFDFIHQIFCSALVYVPLVADFGHPERLALATWPIKGALFTYSFITIFVQTFYLHRVWKMSKGSLVLCIWIGLLILAAFAFNLGFFALVAPLPTWASTKTNKMADTFAIVNSPLSAGADVFITAAMIWYLQQNKTSFARSNAVINRIIFFALNTGLATMICVLIMQTMYHTVDKVQGQIYVAFHMLLAKLYVNSFMASINARNENRANLSSRGQTGVSVSIDTLQNPGSGMRSMDTAAFRGQVNTIESMGATDYEMYDRK